jgi:hypothetical protein
MLHSTNLIFAALKVNIPNYATGVVTTNEVVEAISSLATVGISVRH